jgi:chaperonin cofactor prefoldin
MATYEDDKKTIAELKKAVDSLGNRLTYLEGNAEQAAENLKLGKDIEKLKRQNKVNEKKIESMRKMIHRMKKARDI